MPELDLRLRPARADDASFLFDLYTSTAEDFAALDAAQRDALLRVQFSAQERGYHSQFPGSDHHIIIVGGREAGRVWVNRTRDEIRIVDISLLPAYRRLGIGTAVYRMVLAEAAGRNTPVTASVRKSNTASLDFHRKLGFAVTGETGVYYSLVRSA